MLRRLWSAELPNPGRLEEMKKEAQAILSPDVFDGARFEFNKTLTQKFALNHTVFMGSSAMPASYEFGANFGDESVLLASRIDMAGRLNGRVNCQFSDSWLARLQAQVSPESPSAASSLKLDLDYKGSSCCAGATYMGGGLLGGHYMKSVTPALALGGEVFYHLSKHVRGGGAAARLLLGPKGESVATAKAGSFGNVELAYTHKVSEKVGLATELQYYHGQVCTFGLGYEFRLRQATFKGLIQSDTTCSAALEERVSSGVNLLLSGQLNHKKKDYKFGFGLVIGAQ
jgi:mitochondrial import receptor subunit TOM40